MSTQGSCHCGKTAFRMDGDIPAQFTRCTCSFCAKRGTLLAYCRPDQLHVTTLPDDDVVYRWNTQQVAHHFCTHCGCATYSDSPAFGPNGAWNGSTRRIGVNARLFDDFDAALAPVTVIDGKHLW